MHEAPLFHFSCKPGPYAVGLSVTEQYDYSRIFRDAVDASGEPYAGERARPIQKLIWYPAHDNRTSPMTVADYVRLLASETSFGHPAPSRREQSWVDAMRPSLRTALRALRDAPAIAGSFPVVVYAPSFSGMAWENADLCEYLASHGYVVIASPSLGASTREMTRDVAGINTQARDISFLIGFARKLTHADASRVAVAGFSWGGLSNLIAAARDDRIGALIALDGTFNYLPGLIREVGDVHPERMSIPLLSFSQQPLSREDWSRYIGTEQGGVDSVLNAWTHADVLSIQMAGLIHWQFSSMYQRREDRWTDYFPEQQKGDYTREDGAIGYEWMARYTLAFLNAYLNHDRHAVEFLKSAPSKNGAPCNGMTVDFRASVGLPPSFATLRAQLAREGFARIGDIYARFQRQHCAFKVQEAQFETWSAELIDAGCFADAIAVLELAVWIYPQAARLYTNLGCAHQQLGQRRLALESYNKALQLDPNNMNTRSELKARFRELNNLSCVEGSIATPAA